MNSNDEQFQTMADSIPQLAWIAHADGFIFWYNRRWHDYTGTTPEQMEGWGWQSVHDPVVLPLVMERWQEAIATGQRFEMEFPLRGADGRFRVFLTRVEPVRDAQGNVVRWFGTNTDIDEQKRAQEELSSSLSLLNATIESTADAIMVVDLAGDIVWQNTKLQTMWRYPEKLLQRCNGPERRAYAAEQVKDPDGFLQLLKKHHSTPEIETFDIIEMKDGRTFERYGFPQRVNGKCVGVVVNFRDITERKQIESALRLSEEKYRLLWATAGDAFVLFDQDNTILEVNASLTTILGYMPEEAIGQELALLQPERLREGHRRGLQRYLETGTRTIDWRAAAALGLHRDGREIPIEISFNHLRIEGKDLFAGFIRDVTERKQVEAEREALLASEQKARHEAETANRTKDEFLATLSHELRTPLTAILGWTRMISDNRLSEEDKAQGLEIIQRNALLQAQLVEDILDVSRIVTGKLRMEVRPVELSSVIEGAVESVLPAAQAKEIRLQRVLDSGTSLVSGDPDRLQQVVWNLLMNAIKFTPKGGRVQVRLERVNSHIEIIVADTGTGINPEMLPHVFERFRQADQSSTRSYGGLGLGLAIVRHLVESHGGTVEADSLGQGQGATFTVKLPLMATRSTEAKTEKPAERVHPTAHSDGAATQLGCPSELQGLHVLVVDDDEDARRLVRTVLESCDARVTTVSNAADALSALQSSRPDVLISDLGMPAEDGYSLIKKVRALPRQQGGQTPAAALTAYARAEDRMRVLRSGFQIHLPKPVEPAELVAVVANLVGRASLGD
jgi:PAS domain S-box-containing protein